jgi:phospholipase/carboxylesterase
MPDVSGRITIADPSVDAVLYVPASVLDLESAPLLVFLHGALRTVDAFVDALIPAADENKVIVLAPYADYGTWDAITYGDFGPDVAGVNAALAWVFARWPIDPARIVLSGFSDGATYTLALGRANGDLFSRLVAYSPGFLIGVDPVGQPPILITHGYDDTVLSYAYTSGVIVPELMRAGYRVDFRSFVGSHAVPGSVANEVMRDLARA